MEEINKHKERINTVLRNFLKLKLNKDGKYSKQINELIENIIEFNMRGGKRIRPLLAIAAYKCFKEDDKIFLPSISTELMQAYLLIHDDIMDNSALRRGKPSMHKIYESKENKNLGNSIAILAGNICASYTYDAILESDFDEKSKIESIKNLSWIIARENYGQALDIILDFKTTTEKEILSIYELKTATYTTQGPILIGCALANPSQNEKDILQEYAYNVGVAFQIQDDVIGVFGNEAETGKPSDSDIKEGKKTLLIQKTLELSTPKDKDFVLKNYGKTNLKEEDIEKIREIMRSCGALEYCKNKLSEMVQRGKKSLEKGNFKIKGKTLLLDIADYVKNLAP